MKWLRAFWKSSAKAPPDSAEAVAAAPPVDEQAAGPFIRRDRMQVSLGLDFGTHSTKACYFEFGAGARVFRPIAFDHGLQEWPSYTLPAVGLIRDGALVWGAEAAAELDSRPWREGIRGLKVLVAGSADATFADDALQWDYASELERAGVDADLWLPEHVASAALALQVSEVRRLLSGIYHGRRCDAQFTIPVPIDYVQHSAVLGTYRRIANAADGLVAEDGSLRVAVADLVPAATEAYRAASEDALPDARLYVLPEAVAQVAAYLTSLETAEGVHAIVDIGAGTTDVSIFKVHRSRLGQECYWYSALAIPKASTFAQKAALGTMAPEQRNALTEAEVLRECSAKAAKVEEALDAIRHAANPAWAEGYRHLKVASAWQGCPIFVCGGGSLLPGAPKVFQRCWMPNWSEHRLVELPTPRSFAGNGVPFPRMAVAYGLAIPGPEHGRFVLPKDSPDHTPPRRYKRYDGMGGDQLYPTPSWV